jgi:hypothetical protein
MSLTSDYGPIGSPTRARYEELQQRLAAAKPDALAEQAAEVRAALAAVNDHSDVEMVGQLLVRELALQKMLASAVPLAVEINAQLDALRGEYQSTRARAAQNSLQAQRATQEARARLGELNQLIAAQSPIGNVEYEKQYRGRGLSMAEAQAEGCGIGRQSARNSGNSLASLMMTSSLRVRLMIRGWINCAVRLRRRIKR